jgi:hypothetical protein
MLLHPGLRRHNYKVYFRDKTLKESSWQEALED